MSKVVVVLVAPVPAEGLAALRAVDPRLEIVDASRLFWPQARQLTEAEMAERDRLLAEADVLYNYDRTLPAMLQPVRTPRLRWVQSSAASVHPVRQLGGFDRDLQITNMGGVSVIPSSEWTLCCMLDHVRQSHRMWQNTRDRNYERYTSDELYGKTAVICALGRVGRRIAHLCQAFGMRVWGTRRRVDTFEAPELATVVDRLFRRDELPEVLPHADFLILTMPNTPETRHYIGAAELARLEPSCYLINIGRGSTLDYGALVAALRAGRLAGAAVDVFQEDIQPLPPDDPLWSLPNVVIAPHNAAQTGHPERQVAVFAENLRRYLAGERLMNLIDPKLGY